MFYMFYSLTNLRFSFFILIVEKVDTIVTVQQIVPSNPLSEYPSSLCCYACDVILKTQINLKPLINIITAGYPGSFCYRGSF